jgi:ribosomal protein S18 acetylase RimI-like enzyme
VVSAHLNNCYDTLESIRDSTDRYSCINMIGLLLVLLLLLCFTSFSTVNCVAQPTVRKLASASSITISKIETSEDAYSAAKLSIDVFFKENLPLLNDGSIFSKIQEPFRLKARETMIKTLFSRHLAELNARLGRPNCLILKAVDDESGKIVGFCEMFMSPCLVDAKCGVEECLVAGTELIEGAAVDSAAFDVNENYQDAKILGIATTKEMATEAANNILYYPKIANLAVSPDIRRQGLGSRLLEECLTTARQWKYPAVVLQVEQPNTRAKEFYLSQHFDLVNMDTTTKAWDVSQWELRLVPTPKYFMKKDLSGK